MDGFGLEAEMVAGELVLLAESDVDDDLGEDRLI
jgi:hypothetical protein